MKSYEKAMEDIKYEKMNKYLFILIVNDYIITYIGINILKVIHEGNPLMIWLFEIPFYQGIVVRMIQAGIIISISMAIYKSGFKYYDKFIKTAIGTNILVMIMHSNWAIKHFTSL